MPLTKLSSSIPRAGVVWLSSARPMAHGPPGRNLRQLRDTREPGCMTRCPHRATGVSGALHVPTQGALCEDGSHLT
eukprot:2129672-Lingulodinium_polyedra.AAC.1